jgi:hypothetical protein
MRNLYVNLLIILVMFPCVATAQYKTMELKPIQKHGWQYHYDFKKVSTPEALQIPLLAMEDERIAKYYNTFSGLQLVSGLVMFVPVLYIVYGASNSYYTPEAFWGITITSLAASLVLQIWSHNRMKLAIERYNLLLLPHPTGKGPIGNGVLTLHFRL